MCGLFQGVWALFSRCVGAPLDFPPPLRRTHLPKSLSLFFLPPKIPTCFPSLGVFSLNYGGVVEGRALKYARLGSLDHLVNPLRLHPPGSTRWPCKRAVLRVWALQTPPKRSTTKPTQKEKSGIYGGRKKNSAKCWGSHTAPTSQKNSKEHQNQQNNNNTPIWHKIELAQVELGR